MHVGQFSVNELMYVYNKDIDEGVQVVLSWLLCGWTSRSSILLVSSGAEFIMIRCL